MFNNNQLLLVLVVTLCAVYVLSQNGSSGSNGSQSEANKLTQKVKALAEEKKAEANTPEEIADADQILATIQKMSEDRDAQTKQYIATLTDIEQRLNASPAVPLTIPK